jgi:malate dehydrogenase (oxaloacetate-decarboxylating)(NADP+)
VPTIVAAIEDFKPTVLIGVSTVGKLFSREVVETMSRLNAQPIIFALSNPIDKHECLPEQAIPAGSSRRANFPAFTGQQPVYLPRRRHGHLRHERETRDRRNVH